MALNWNEIKERALNFFKEWAGTHSECRPMETSTQAR